MLVQVTKPQAASRMALIFFFFKQHLSRYPKPGDFFGFGGFCLFVCLFGWVFFSAKGLPWLCGQSSKWWIIIRGLLLEKQESSLGGGEVLGGGGEGWGKGRGGGGGGTRAWRGRGLPRTSASRWAGLPSLRGEDRRRVISGAGARGFASRPLPASAGKSFEQARCQRALNQE